jgi:putative endonuclease
MHGRSVGARRARSSLSPSTVEIGSEAEAIACRTLEEHGYRVVERNFRCRIGELDIVARDGDVLVFVEVHGAVLVFVEVRSRRDDAHGHAAEAVGPRKQRRVIRAARFYLAAMRPAFDECRFDVVAITGDAVELFKDAFRPTR